MVLSRCKSVCADLYYMISQDRLRTNSGKLDYDHGLLLCASAVVTASLASFILGLVMIVVIIIARCSFMDFRFIDRHLWFYLSSSLPGNFIVLHVILPCHCHVDNIWPILSARHYTFNSSKFICHCHGNYIRRFPHNCFILHQSYQLHIVNDTFAVLYIIENFVMQLLKLRWPICVILHHLVVPNYIKPLVIIISR